MTVFQMQTNEHGPDFFDYLNPDLPHEERFSESRLLTQSEVEVSREVYWYMLELMPPAFFKPDHSFVVCEPITHRHNGNPIVNKYIKRGDRYFHNVIEIDAAVWDREVEG